MIAEAARTIPITVTRRRRASEYGNRFHRKSGGACAAVVRAMNRGAGGRPRSPRRAGNWGNAEATAMRESTPKPRWTTSRAIVEPSAGSRDSTAAMSTPITARSDSSRPDPTMRPSLASCNTRAQRTEAAPDGGDSLGDSRTGAPVGSRARSGVSSRARWTSIVGRFGLRSDLLDLIGRDGDRRDRIRHRRCRWCDDRLVRVLVRVVEERQVVLVAVEDVVDDLLAAQSHEVVAFGAGLGEDLDPVVDVVAARGAAGAEGRNVRLDGGDLVMEVALVAHVDDERVLVDPGAL